METRTCRTCGEVKPADEFYSSTHQGRVKFSSYCKPCHRARGKAYRLEHAPKKRGIERRSRLLSTYGLTIEQYDELLARQGGGCAICGVGPGDKSLHVDHDHSTGTVRGILCSRCNRGIGNFGDDPDRLVQAAYYLKGQP